MFRSKRGDRLKLLFWDEDGLVLYYKRLEVGTFVLPQADDQRVRAGEHGLVLKPAELAMLLAGIDLDAKRHKRYQTASDNAGRSCGHHFFASRIVSVTAYCHSSQTVLPFLLFSRFFRERFCGRRSSMNT